MPDLSQRVHDPELMDDPSGSEKAFAVAYRELTVINRLLGGVRAVRRFLPGIEGGRLLDVAAGACDIGDALAAAGEWAVVGLDRDVRGLRFASRSVPVVGDAFDLPFDDGSFDLVTASLFFHHLSDEDCVQVLKNMYRVARRRVIVNDLHRAPLAHMSIAVLTRLFSNSVMVRHDAPLSVRRGFRPAEMVRLAERAGITASVYRSFPYRLVLVADK